jgi:pilus assembly protein CpaF
MMVMMAGFELPISVIRQYIRSAITVVVHLSRLKGGKRRMMRLCEVIGLKEGRYVVRDLMRFQQQGVHDGMAFGAFYATGKAPKCLERIQAAGIHMPEELFERRVLETCEFTDQNDLQGDWTNRLEEQAEVV